MEIEMTSRALSGQKDGVEVSIGSFSWALAARMELAPKPIEAAVLAGINAPSSWSLPALPTCRPCTRRCWGRPYQGRRLAKLRREGRAFYRQYTSFGRAARL